MVAEGDQRIFGHLLHSWAAQLVSHPAMLEAVKDDNLDDLDERPPEVYHLEVV